MHGQTTRGPDVKWSTTQPLTRKEILTPSTPRMKLEDTLLSETDRSQEDNVFVFQIFDSTYLRNSQREIQSRRVARSRAEGGGEVVKWVQSLRLVR